MNAKRREGSKRTRGSRVATDGAMGAVEEKVVRMRKGLAAPDDLELERVGQNHPATRAKLEEIEARALARSGRLDELREEVGLPVARTDTAKKQKIISRLAKPKKTAKVAAKAPARAKPKSKSR